MAVDTGGTILLISPFCRIHVFCGVFSALNQDVWDFRSNVLTESQPTNLHARKLSHLMSWGEAIGGCMSPEQLEICFLNKSSLVWSLWAAWVESLFSTSISIALFLFSDLIRWINAESATYSYLFTRCYLSKAVCEKFCMLSEGSRITLSTGKLQFVIVPVDLVYCNNGNKAPGDQEKHVSFVWLLD